MLKNLVACVRVVLLVDKCQNRWVHVVGETIGICITREVWGLSFFHVVVDLGHGIFQGGFVVYCN